MTPEQLQHRREYQRKRSAMVEANFKRKNPGKTPLPMVTIWKKKKAAA